MVITDEVRDERCWISDLHQPNCLDAMKSTDAWMDRDMNVVFNRENFKYCTMKNCRKWIRKNFLHVSFAIIQSWECFTTWPEIFIGCECASLCHKIIHLILQALYLSMYLFGKQKWDTSWYKASDQVWRKVSHGFWWKRQKSRGISRQKWSCSWIIYRSKQRDLC